MLMKDFRRELITLMYGVGIVTETVASFMMDEHIQIKKDFSPVTLADFSAQIFISHWINMNFSEEPLIAEETLNSIPEESRFDFIGTLKLVMEPFLPLNRKKIIERLEMNQCSTKEKSYWVLDPLDGTKGFLRGNQYAISLAHISDGVIDAGALACPRLGLPDLPGRPEAPDEGRIFVALRGQGAWGQIYSLSVEPVPIHVSECKDPQKATLLRSYESRHTDLEKTGLFLSKMGIPYSIPIDSQVKYGLLACGEGEFILRFPPTDNPDYREKVWDHAGGAIILEEAGGKVTDIFGKAFQYKGEPLLNNSVGVFASNGHLHDVGIKVLQQVMRVQQEKE